MFLFLLILFILFNINLTFCQSSIDETASSLNRTKIDEVIKINVAGEILSTSYSTLTYISNTKLSLFNLWPRDENGYMFLDFRPDLFKDFLSQLRRWSIRNNQSDDIRFEPSSWKVKNEFNEMIISLGFEKYQQIPPIQCIKHKVVNDFTHRVGSAMGNSCDTNETSGWTRFVDQAGTIIVDYVPERELRYSGCGGGQSPGWFFGTYPTRFYSTTIGTICYAAPVTGVPCERFANQSISVTHCGDYFVFDRPVAPACPLRVCTIDRAIPF
ncbi:unnamed protein product [Adineta steineri]|uniref:Uncharacterized protein n=1 Tax=Adineta steineri TaxID=433720 RepID=A0A819LP09_9BILA|nr:unnamed protein product [Adineta steineri]CAF1438399.1 unnamed protein product [Adineta steineri]CAF3707094.1 unnamed protein product [Adineta steineri]CAF3969252.1 unnamed protein product [Adineta steineri]